MLRLPRIVEIAESSEGFGFYLCARKELRTGRGGDFVSLVLQDMSGQMPAKIFDRVETLNQEFEVGEFVKIEAKGNRHHDRLELMIESIRRVNPDQDRREGFREEDCIPSAPRPIEEMWAELQAHIAAARNPWVRQLLTSIVEARAERLKIWPAAVTVHHAYRGGLLEHVLKLTEVGGAMAAAYGADADMLLAGAVLHDIGKLDELHYEGGVTSYSRDGNLLGHITIGVLIVRDAAAAIPGFPDDLLVRIEHLVVSHHGERELGSPVEPMSEEAFILSAIDDLDARLHQVRRHVAHDSREGDITAYHRRFGRVLLKPFGR
jgi:3'-5' exoribonuclease